MTSNQMNQNPNSNPNRIESTEYEIFWWAGKTLMKETLEFDQNETIEQCIFWIFDNRRNVFAGENPSNYDFHIAKKNGEAKDDYPGWLTSDGPFTKNRDYRGKEIRSSQKNKTLSCESKRRDRELLFLSCQTQESI